MYRDATTWVIFLMVFAWGASLAQGKSAEPGASLPLFEAFKTFCVDTDAVPEAVNKAVKLAGGTPHNPPGCSTEDGTCVGAPFPLAISMWDVVVGGHRFSVTAGSAWPSRKFRTRTSDMEHCDINSRQNEDQSIAAIRKWVGVGPSQVSLPSASNEYSPHLTMYSYNYQVTGSARTAMKTADSLRKAAAEGRSWSLELMREPDSASLRLSHDLPSFNESPTSTK